MKYLLLIPILPIVYLFHLRREYQREKAEDGARRAKGGGDLGGE